MVPAGKTIWKLLSLLLVLNGNYCFGQHNYAVDTTRANEYIRKGNVSFDGNDIDSAIFYFNQSIEVLKPLNNPNIIQIADGKKNLGVAYIEKGKYELAKDYFEQALPIYEHHRDSAGIGDCINNIGVVHHYLGEYSEAVEYYIKALKIREKILGETNRRVAYSYQNIGNIYNVLGKFGLSLRYSNHALQIQRKLLGDDDLDVASCYNLIGIINNQMGNYDEALGYHQKALRIRKKLSGEYSADAAESYLNMGVIYKEKGDYALALEYTKRAIGSYEKTYGSDHPYVASFYVNMGVLYQDLGNLDEARNYFLKPLRIYQLHFGKDYPKLAIIFENLGILEVAQGHSTVAYDDMKKALSIYRKNFGTENPDVARSYVNLGDLAFTESGYKKAMDNYLMALGIRKKVYRGKHPLIATVYNKMADVRLRQNRATDALACCQLALVNNNRTFQDSTIAANPTLDNFLDANVLLETFHLKARTFTQLFEAGNDKKELERSLSTYLLCADLIENIRDAHLNDQDKIKTGEEYAQIFEAAIDNCYTLFTLTSNPYYLNTAFNLSERSRASVLRMALADVSAQKFGGIPDSLLAFEKKIKHDITFYQNKIQDANEGMRGDDTTKAKKDEGNLFSLRRTYDSLVEAFEKNYPKYYALKYQNHQSDIAGIQQKLKKSKTAMIDYFLGDSTLYTFVITDNAARLLKVKIARDFNDQINVYRKNTSPNEILQNSQKVFSGFVTGSKALYTLLFEPVSQYIPSEITHLTIVPSGELAIIPFESLLMEGEIPDRVDYQDLPYLVKKFNIGYAYSATLWSEQTGSHMHWKTQFAGYAPEYNTKLLADSRELAPYGNFRDGITNLLFTKEEVKNAEIAFPGEVFIGKAATESAFKQHEGQDRIIHLAMHALVDGDNPLYFQIDIFPGNKRHPQRWFPQCL